MNDNLLSVPQFAKVATRSKQSIYEAARNKNSKLYPYVVMRDNRLYIKAAALKLYQDGSHQDSQDSQGDGQDGSHQDNQDSQGDKTAEPRTASQKFAVSGQGQGQGQGQGVNQDYGQGQSRQNNQDNTGSAGQGQSFIDFLQEQLKEKDKQIERLQTLLAQQQQINYQNSLLLLEQGKATEDEPPQEQQEVVIETKEEHQEPKKRKNWFLRWLYGED